MKVWYDTEFIETGPQNAIQFVSIGMVREDGAEYYAVNGDLSEDWQWYMREHPWLGPNVWEQLPLTQPIAPDAVGWINSQHPSVKQSGQIARDVALFCAEGLAQDEKAELWADYGAYDHVVLAGLFGTMMDLPSHMPMYTHDLRQAIDMLNPGWVVPQPDWGAHHALADAQWVRDRYWDLDSYTGHVLGVRL